MDAKPKLRQLNVIPFEEDGQPAFCLKDQSGICPGMMLLTPVGFFLASLCDGTRTLADVRAAFKQQFGEDIPAGQLESLLERLDEGLMLESDRFREHRAARVKAFLDAPVRPASHAGAAYPKSVSALQRRLDGFFTHGDGPGPVGEAAADSGVVAVAAPHIDFERGGPAYAHAYKELVEHCTASTFVILGTLHEGAERPYIVTDKDFGTPFGPVKCDREFVAALRQRADLPVCEEEFLHCNEHSVEFQAVFLRHFFGAACPVKIVPVLCGPLLPRLTDGQRPEDDPAVGTFITALRSLLSEYGEEAAVIASVDLSHVGKQFCQDVDLDENVLKWVAQEDRAMLDFVQSLDADGFLARGKETKNRTNICGFPALYTLMRVIEARSGRLLHYGQAPNEATQSVVSFAAMAFDR